MMNDNKDKQLDRNIGQLMNSGFEQPTMADDRKESMLAALKAKQSENAPKATPNPLSTRILLWSAAAVLLLVLGVWVYSKVNPQDGPNNTGPDNGGSSIVGNPDGEDDRQTPSEDENQQQPKLMPPPHRGADESLVRPDPLPPAPLPKRKPEVRRFGGVERRILQDGSIVVARPNAKYTVSGKRQLKLERGELYVIVSEAPVPFMILTANGEVAAHGTRFVVSAEKSTTVAVAQGEVRLSSAKGTATVLRGQRGELRADGKPVTASAKRMSYLIDWAREALAQEELLAKRPLTNGGLIIRARNGQESYLTLRSYGIDVHIENGIARTTIDQTFFNHLYSNAEGTFYFPLPPNASISRLAMYVNGKRMEGGMVERGRGQKIYNTIRHQRRDPALLETMEGNTYKLRIFPLEARQEKRIFLSFTQPLESLYGTLRYWLPMDHVNSSAGKFWINFRVRDGIDLYTANCPTYNLEPQKAGKDILLRYDAKDVCPNKDLLVHLTPIDSAARHGLFTCQSGGHTYVSVRITPDIHVPIAPRPRQWIVVNDTSASRSQLDLKTQAYVVQRVLAEADDHDTITLIQLDTQAKLISSRLVPVRSSAAQSFPKTILKANALGGTNLELGLRTAAAFIKAKKCDNPHVLYVGDGVATDGKTTPVDTVKELPPEATFIGIAVGKKLDMRFLGTAARKTGGYATSLTPYDDLNWRVLDVMSALSTPRLRDLHYEFRAPNGDVITMEAYGDKGVVAGGESLVISARGTKVKPAELVVTGKLGNKEFRSSHNMRQAVEGTFIPRLWATAHISELLLRGDRHRKEIVKLSKHFYVTTPYTSLIVLEDDKMYKEFKVEKGRKDHWAIYPAPEKIKVVREWNERDATQYLQAQDRWQPDKSKLPPLERLLSSVLIRRVTPFYARNSQDQAALRHALYNIASAKGLKPGVEGALTALQMGHGHRQAVAHLGELSPQVERQLRDVRQEQVRQARLWQRRQTDNLQTQIHENHIKRLTLRETQLKQQSKAVDPGVSSELSRVRRELAERYYQFSQHLIERAKQDIDAHHFATAKTKIAKAIEYDPTMRDAARMLQKRIEQLRIVIEIQERTDEHVADPAYQERIRDILIKKAEAKVFMDHNVWKRARDAYEDVLLKDPADEQAIEGLSRLYQQLQQAARLRRRSLEAERMAEIEWKWIDPIGPGDIRLSGSASRGGFTYVPWHSYQVFDQTGRIDTYDYFSPVVVSDSAFETTWTNATTFSYSSTRAALATGSLGFTASDGILPHFVSRGSSSWYSTLYLDGHVQTVTPTIWYSLADRGLLTGTLGYQNVAPGLLGAAINDLLLPRERALAGKKGQKLREELQSIKLLRSKALAAAMEKENVYAIIHGKDPGTLPAWQFMQTVVSVRPNGPRMRDLTQFCPGLHSNRQDLRELLEEALGMTIAKGSAAATVAKMIGDARSKAISFCVRHGKRGEVVTVRDGKHFRIERRTGMYLKEEIICDGTHVYHVYPTLGLAARRKATPTRLAALAEAFPHVVPTTERLTRRANVSLVESNKEHFVLRLTPLKGNDVHQILKVARNGHILEYTTWRQKKLLMRQKFSYSEDKVAISWSGTDGETVATQRYQLKQIETPVEACAFNAANYLVYDMPLRTPNHYEAELAKIKKGVNTVPQQESILQHQALSWLQYGTPHLAREKAADARALNRALGRNRRKGEMVIGVAAGDSSKDLIKDSAAAGKSPLAQYSGLLQEHTKSEPWKNLMSLDPKGFIGHLAAFHAACIRKDIRLLAAQWPRSPLLYAAATHSCEQGVEVDTWKELFDHPYLGATAVYVAAEYAQTTEQKQTVLKAQLKLDRKMLEKQQMLPLSLNMITALQEDEALQKDFLTRRNEALASCKRPLPWLLHAELLLKLKQTEAGQAALARAQGLLDPKRPALNLLTMGQAYWACGLHNQALLRYRQLVDLLTQNKIDPSPALLSTVARLAHRTKDPVTAIAFEKRSIAMATVGASEALFYSVTGTRSDWLWQLYEEAIAGTDDKETKSTLLREAEETWLLWHRAQPAGAEQKMRRLAELHIRVNDDLDRAWYYMSTIIDRKPRDAASHADIAQWHYAADRRDEAQKAYAKAYKWDTANPQWLFEQGKILKAMGRKDDARAVFKKIIDGKWAPGLEQYKRYAKREM